MADKRISELTAATSLADADLIPIVQGGETKRLSGSAFKAYVASTDQPSVISVNSSSNALRITQTGAGNALVVEDEANPDSTPFVIGSTGQLVRGHTTTINIVNPATGSANGPQLETVATSIGGAGVGSVLYLANAGQSGYFALAKSRGTTVGDMTSLINGDTIGYLTWQGSDGTNFIQAANITAVVDGTPGTNDMPGRLVFSTTADGASSPTERMRIDNAGRININSTFGAATQVGVGGTLTSGTANSYGFHVQATIPSSSTSTGISFRSNPSTQAAAFTLSGMSHFSAVQGTFGAGSTVTTQQGFYADSSLTGATNNYGFYSSIASGTGRYNFYAAGTADNYFAGNVGLGVAPTSKLDILSQDAIKVTGYQPFQTWRDSNDSNKGCRIQVVSGDLLFSNDATGGGTYAINMRIDSAGRVGIGGTPPVSTSLTVGKNITGGVNSYGVYENGSIQSDVTTGAQIFSTYPSTAAAAFTLSNLTHYAANQGTIGAGSTVTNQIGFYALSGLTGATNNYGFYSNIASGTGRYNFYAVGSASNYLGGDLTFKPLASATPANNGDLTFEATSNTSVKIKLKGSDGVVRSVTLTLA